MQEGKNQEYIIITTNRGGFKGKRKDWAWPIVGPPFYFYKIIRL